VSAALADEVDHVFDDERYRHRHKSADQGRTEGADEVGAVSEAVTE
jgi:hypothetical protein